MSRMRLAGYALLLLAAFPAMGAAQERLAPDAPYEPVSAQPDGALDILVDTTPPPSAGDLRDCLRQQEIAAIQGEIVVCGDRGRSNEHRLYSAEEAEERYAKETMHAGMTPTPDIAGQGIFRGPATVGGLCFVPPCPKEPAIAVDFDALPEPPAGSDADLIRRGEKRAR